MRFGVCLGYNFVLESMVLSTEPALGSVASNSMGWVAV